MTNVILPSLGQTTTELEILRWFKNEGDAVRAGDILLEVQTDKAVVELPATADGVLRDIRHQAGAVVEVGTVLAQIVSAGEIAEPTPPPALSPAVALSVAPARSVAPAQAPSPATRTGPRVIPATPLARAVAREKKIDLATLVGTGMSGLIKRADVLQAAAANPAVSSAAAPDRHPLSPMRRTIARRMLESKQTIPHYYMTIHANVTALVALRAALKNDVGDAPSLNAFLLVALARTLGAFPAMNASFESDSIVEYAEIHIGIAVQVPGGLLVPVLRDADRRDLFQLDSAFDGLVERARTGTLSAPESGGAHFTLSNLGQFGVDEFSAIINPGQAAILAVGRIRHTQIFDGAAFVAGHELSLTLSVDHRIVDGAIAAQFLRALVDELEHPYSMWAKRDKNDVDWD